VTPNNPSGLDNNSEDEVSLQDLGLFEADSNPAVQVRPTVVEPVTALENQATQEYVEIETYRPEDLEGKLACAICYQPYYPSEFTVVSKERLNFEAAIVVCPQCLAEMQSEVKRSTAGSDLTLGAIWGGVTALIWTTIMCWLIWAQRGATNYDVFWWWIGFYSAFVPGWLIGKAVFTGVGRKFSRRQQALAVFFTFSSIFIQFWIGQMAFFNFLDEIKAQGNHPVEGIGPVDALRRLLPGLVNIGPLFSLAIISTGLIGLLTAWFVSEGPRLYTRPFVQPERIKKSRLAQFRQFLNV
jgi:hypothetical protein